MESKVILITGGSSGLGREMAKNLSSKGHTVYGTSRRANGIEILDNFNLIKLDVTDEASINEAIELLISKEGRLDVLINNAGLSITGPLEHTQKSEIESIFNTNVYGLLSTTKIALPHIRKTKGNIINVSSLAGVFALPYRSVYSASKFAVEALTESLSMEVSQFGVNVSVIQPGDLNTNLNQNRAESNIPENSVYYKIYKSHLSDIKEEMSQSMDPAVIGELVSDILKSKNPKLKYQVGSSMQKASTTIKKFLPDRIFEKLLKKHFKLN